MSSFAYMYALIELILAINQIIQDSHFLRPLRPSRAKAYHVTMWIDTF